MKSMVTVVSFPGGPAVNLEISVSGGVLSTVTMRMTAVALPARSVAEAP